MKINFSQLLIAGLCLSLATLQLAIAAEPKKELDANQAYSAEKTDPVTHTVDFSVVVTPPYHSKVLKIWLPIPPSDSAQEISDSQISTFPIELKPQIHVEPEFGNKFAYFEFHDPQGAQLIRHKFTARLSNMHWKLEPDQVHLVEEWPEAFERYLQYKTVEKQDEFNKLVSTLAPKRSVSATNLFQALQWVDQNMTYAHEAASLRADASYAFGSHRGHCSDYHGLCSTMARAMGYPARVTYGMNLFDKNSPSHCKLEAYLPPYGWVSFDVSETQRMIAKIEKDKTLSAQRKEALIMAARTRLKEGFRENSWLLVTKGTNYELAPPASQPVSVVRTIYAEADGVALPDPDPANEHKREFAWMTIHKYSADRPFIKPFENIDSLQVK